MAVADTSIAIKVSKENDHGQVAHPAFAHPNGKHLRGCQSDKPIDTRLAKLLLPFYKTKPERPMALCEPAT
jgi:hypothetical protein